METVCSVQPTVYTVRTMLVASLASLHTTTVTEHALCVPIIATTARIRANVSAVFMDLPINRPAVWS